MKDRFSFARFRRLSSLYFRFILWVLILLTAGALITLNVDPNGRLAATLDHYTSPAAKPLTLR